MKYKFKYDTDVKNRYGENLNENKKFFSKIGFNYLIFAAVAIILQVILMNIATLANIDIFSNYNTLTIFTAICNYVLPLPVIVYLMKKIDKESIEKHSLSAMTFLKYLAITLTLIWVGNIVGLVITTLLGGLAQTSITNPVQELINSTDIWLNLLLISIIGPIFEEFFFRKLLIDRTIKYGARVSIIISAVIFGFFHGNLNQFFYAFFIGGFFAYVYIKTGNIIYTMILHIITNLMGSVVSIFVASSAHAIASGTFYPADLAISLIYLLIIVMAFLIGLISLASYNKYKLNGLKTKIGLRHPIKTMLLNYGMILFMVFCTFEIIYQLIC